MDFKRLMSGTVPFETPIPVYKAGSVLDQGAIVCATADTASLQGASISVATTTGACDSVLGVTVVSSLRASAARENAKLYNIPSDGIPDVTTVGAGTAGGMSFVPCLVNMDALFYATYSTTTGTTSTGDSKTVGITASTGTSVILGSSGVDHAGGWLFSSPTTNTAGGTPTFSGSLRWVGATGGSDSYGLVTAMSVSADGVMLFATKIGKKLTTISSGGNYLRSHGAGTAGFVDQNLLVRDVLIRHDNSGGVVPLRKWVHDGLDGLTGVELMAEVSICDWFYQSID